jgi:hypothetical protein
MGPALAEHQVPTPGAADGTDGRAWHPLKVSLPDRHGPPYHRGVTAFSQLAGSPTSTLSNRCSPTPWPRRGRLPPVEGLDTGALTGFTQPIGIELIG